MTTPQADESFPDSAEAAVRKAADAALEHGGEDIPNVYFDMARSTRLSEQWARRLARSALAELRSIVASNPTTPPDVLVSLTADRRPLVSDAALANPATPFSLVDAHLLGEPYKHPDCPVERLLAAVDRAGDDAGTLLRSGVLTHPKLPQPVRERLAGEHPRLVGALLENPAVTHPEALRLIAAVDTADLVSADELAAIWRYHRHADGQWLAEQARPSLAVVIDDGPAEAANPYDACLTAVAQNPATPPATLAQIVSAYMNVPRRKRRLYGPHVEALVNPACPPAAMLTALAHPAPAAHGSGPQPAVWLLMHLAEHPRANTRVLQRIRVRDLGARPHFGFIARHATDGPHARAVISLWPTWSGNLATLLSAAAAILTPAS